MSRDLTAAEELYERLETLSKELEGSDRIDAHENRDAYPTILDAMNFVCAQASPAPTALEVHLGDMRESNGRVTWIVTLCRAGQSVFEGYQVYADAIKGRAEYEAAALKHLLGQGPKPDLLAFDTDPPKASPAPEPVARLYSDLANRLANQPVDAWRFDGVESTIVLGALIRAERVTALEQRAETAEHDLQILTTERDAAVADAERYRWLKECTNEQFEHLSGQWCALDLTIDVMMKIEHNGGYASTSAMKCQHVFDDDRCVICGSVA